MKVILLDDVDGVGYRGDAVEVADGYARNYLIPRNQALRATPAAIKIAKERNRIAERKEIGVRTAAHEQASLLVGKSLTFTVNAGEEGKLFGSVTASDIAGELTKEVAGLEIGKHDVELKEPIKTLGSYSVPIRLFRDVKATIQVQVVPQSPEPAATTAAVEPTGAAEPGEEQESDTPDVENATTDA